MCVADVNNSHLITTNTLETVLGTGRVQKKDCDNWYKPLERSYKRTGIYYDCLVTVSHPIILNLHIL